MRKAQLLAWMRWLIIDPIALWFCLAPLLTAVVFVWFCTWNDGEARSRWAGTMLQLLGLVTTAIGIQQTRKQFGHPSIFTKLGGWYARRPRRDTGLITATGVMSSTGRATLTAVGSTAAPPVSSIEELLKRLEQWLPLIELRANALDQRLVDEANTRKQSDEEEGNLREAADEQLRSRLEMSATGGLRLSTVGLAWLVLGTILAGISPEIAASVGAPAVAGTHLRYTYPTLWPVVVGILYLGIALGFSLFYALKAIDILTDKKTLKGAALFHQRWLNFSGSIAGWICLWFVGKKVCQHVISGIDPTIGWPYAALSLVGFIGIIGYLPFTVVKLITSIGGLVEKIPGISAPKGE